MTVKPPLLALLLSSVLAAPLSGCGFTPVYGNGMTQSEGPIRVGEIPGRAGHVLRKELLTVLRNGLPNVKAANLQVAYEDDLRTFPLAPDGASIRTQIVAQATYVLYTDEGTLSGTVDGVTSYTAPNQPYADVSAQISAQERAANVIARRLVGELRAKAKRGVFETLGE